MGTRGGDISRENTVRHQIKIATDIAPEVQEVIQDTPLADSKPAACMSHGLTEPVATSPRLEALIIIGCD